MTGFNLTGAMKSASKNWQRAYSQALFSDNKHLFDVGIDESAVSIKVPSSKSAPEDARLDKEETKIVGMILSRLNHAGLSIKIINNLSGVYAFNDKPKLGAHDSDNNSISLSRDLLKRCKEPDGNSLNELAFVVAQEIGSLIGDELEKNDAFGNKDSVTNIDETVNDTKKIDRLSKDEAVSYAKGFLSQEIPYLIGEIERLDVSKSEFDYKDKKAEMESKLDRYLMALDQIESKFPDDFSIESKETNAPDQFNETLNRFIKDYIRDSLDWEDAFLDDEVINSAQEAVDYGLTKLLGESYSENPLKMSHAMSVTENLIKDKINNYRQQKVKHEQSKEIEDLKTDLARYYQVEREQIEVKEDELPIRDDARRAIESLFGRRIIGFKGEAYASAFNGLILPDRQGQIYVASDSEMPIMNIAGHEFLHALNKDSPEIYDALLQEMMPLIRNEQVYKAKLDKARKEQGKEESTFGFLLEEMIADVLGDNFTKPTFWAKVAQGMDEKSPGLFPQLASKVTLFLDTLKTKLNPLGHDSYISDVDKAQDAVAKYTALHIKAQLGDKNAIELDEGLAKDFDRGEREKSIDANIGYSDKRIDSLIPQYSTFRGHSKAVVSLVNPNDFLLATTTDPKTIRDEAGILDIDRLTTEIQAPFLTVKDGQIIGHEGRHRMAAMAEAGYEQVPVILQSFSYMVGDDAKNNDFLHFRDELGLGDGNEAMLKAQVEGARDVEVSGFEIVNWDNRARIADLVGNKDIKFMFAGLNAASADSERYSRAKAMLDFGVDAEEVRKETGWDKGIDEKWRFEIDDSQAEIRKPFPDKGQSWGAIYDSVMSDGIASEGFDFGVKLSDVLEHKLLFSAYPELAELELLVKEGGGASITPKANDQPSYIRIGKNVLMTDLKSILLHEAQHGIQHIENFARGGSTDEFKRSEADKARESLASIVLDTINQGENIDDVVLELKREVLDRNPITDNTYSAEEFSAAVELLNSNDKLGLVSKWSENSKVAIDSFESYKLLAGEVEARNTQSRMKMSEAERQITHPASTEDVARNEQSIRYRNGLMQSIDTNSDFNMNEIEGAVVKTDTHKTMFKEVFSGGETSPKGVFARVFALSLTQKNFAETHFKKPLGFIKDQVSRLEEKLSQGVTKGSTPKKPKM